MIQLLVYADVSLRSIFVFKTHSDLLTNYDIQKKTYKDSINVEPLRFHASFQK